MKTKQELRGELKKKRAAIPTDRKKELDAAIVRAIFSSSLFRNADQILLYAPHGSEIDLLPLIRMAQKSGKRVAFPRCDTESETMRFYELLPQARLSAGAYGICEPPADAPLCTPDARTLCILPALTVDPFGNRLGYGKGYYDKFLADFDGVTLCAAYGELVERALPAEAHDIPTRYLCTERGIFSARQKDGGKRVKKASRTADAGKKVASFVKTHAVRFGSAAIKKAGDVRDALRERDGANETAKPLHAPAILTLVTFVLLLLSRFVEPFFQRDNEYAGIILLQILIFLLPALLYAKLRGDRFPSRIRMRLIRPEHLWFTLCLLVLMITGSLLTSILTGGIASLSGNFTLYSLFIARLGGGAMENVWVILAYAVLPAFAEELVFRSFLCAEYERFGVAISITVSSLLFAMLHFSFPLFLTYLFLGILLGGALYATRSFLTVFLLHFGYNLFCLFGQPYLSAFYVTAGSNEIFLFSLGVLFLLFAAFAAGEARKIYHSYARKNLDSSYTVSLPWSSFPRTLARALLSPVNAAILALWLVVSILHLLF